MQLEGRQGSAAGGPRVLVITRRLLPPWCLDLRAFIKWATVAVAG